MRTKVRIRNSQSRRSLDDACFRKPYDQFFATYVVECPLLLPRAAPYHPSASVLKKTSVYITPCVCRRCDYKGYQTQLTSLSEIDRQPTVTTLVCSAQPIPHVELTLNDTFCSAVAGWLSSSLCLSAGARVHPRGRHSQRTVQSRTRRSKVIWN